MTARIEILTVRDPDSATDITVFIDGKPTTHYVQWDVDPGAGHMLSDWRDEVQAVRDGDYSPAFKEAAIAALDAYSDSQYIEDDRTSLPLSWIADSLADAVDIPEEDDANIARAGGTAVIWCTAPTGQVICITDGDTEGSPFTPDRIDEVQVFKFAVGLYPSEEEYLDGAVYESLTYIEANLDTLATTVAQLLKKEDQ